ncbi:mechanosensitive ion channel family protein [Lysobacter sp. A03]|uniref:mechanosensitive ion channel family protein n=1 Tax=Lysobacter sp. A03 TaxID=1199154 RepID=UPI0005B6C91E|nr:mechanosensitive ion channel family protein [Lysobacter sp. A03]KIQ96488.1 Small-conductance mechanosensitive channel [Lysobacter sp. A03]
MKDQLPLWTQQWLDVLVPAGQIVLILIAAWALRALGRRLINRVSRRYNLLPQVAVGGRRLIGFLVSFGALLLILERFGVSGTILWTAFTGFAAVGAVAFFAAWSVLSNIFCTALILTTRPFRLHDHIELLENGEKPGLKGQVVDINLIYTTLQECIDGKSSSVLQVPNNLFFQRTVRRHLPARGGANPTATTTQTQVATTYRGVLGGAAEQSANRRYGLPDA